MFQTWWDLNKQNIRKLIDTAMGILAGYGAVLGEWQPIALGVLGLVINYAWFWIDNKNKVSIQGLEKAGETNAAATLKSTMGK